MSFQTKSSHCDLVKCANTECSASHVFSISADGTPESISLWAKEAFPQNVQQQRAFQILAANFVLRFFSKLQFANITHENIYLEYQRCKRLLKIMAGKRHKSQQLLIFVIGAARLGKEPVVHEFLHYAELYCSYIQQPFATVTSLQNTVSGTATIVRTSYQFFDIIAIPSNYDVFKNRYCANISMSNILTNSTSQLSLNDFKRMYITKYPTMQSQKEDDTEYYQILQYTKTKLADQRFHNHFYEPTHQQVQMLIVDEITYSTSLNIENLGKKIKLLNNKNDRIFCGTDMLVIANFCQLSPVTSQVSYNSTYF